VTSEKRREDVEYALRLVDQMAERWENRFALDNPRFVERYVEGELRLVVRCRRSGPSLDSEECVAVFERELSVSRAERKGRIGDGLIQPRDGHFRVDDYRGVCAADGEQKPMLVGRVETVQTPEGVIPSLVWLQLAKDFERVWGGSVYASDSAPAFEVILAVSDWEHRSFVGRPAARLDKLPREQIKRRPEVMDDVSDDKRDALGRIAADPDAIDEISSISFFLGHDRVWVGREEIANGSMCFGEVMLGPLDLHPRPKKAIRGH
jgi:hypothetical protein